MYGNQSFGGANRGPASQKPRRRSNIFVDFGTVALAVVCGGVIALQYAPLCTSTGFNVATGHLNGVGVQSSARSSSSYYAYRSGGRGRLLVSCLHADFSFTAASGKSYNSTVESVPIFTLAALNLMQLTDKTDRNGLTVRYDPNNPQNCVPVEVVECFGQTALFSYVIAFFVGLIVLALAGMANLSGETWRPGMRTDAY